VNLPLKTVAVRKRSDHLVQQGDVVDDGELRQKVPPGSV
jgi:hypothetical protein